MFKFIVYMSLFNCYLESIAPSMLTGCRLLEATNQAQMMTLPPDGIRL